MLYGSAFPAFSLGPAQCLCWHQKGWEDLGGLGCWESGVVCDCLCLCRWLGDAMPHSERPGWRLCPILRHLENMAGLVLLILLPSPPPSTQEAVCGLYHCQV